MTLREQIILTITDFLKLPWLYLFITTGILMAVFQSQIVVFLFWLFFSVIYRFYLNRIPSDKVPLFSTIGSSVVFVFGYLLAFVLATAEPGGAHFFEVVFVCFVFCVFFLMPKLHAVQAARFRKQSQKS